jgi:DDE superfamily endonuclease
VLAARAPGLAGQLERALAGGTPYLILDGKIAGTGRCREKTTSRRKGKITGLWYSGKTRGFGGNIQALFYPSGIPLRVSGVLPGNVHDLAAARESVLAVLRPFLDAMPVLAGLGYEGAGHGVHVPVRKPAGVKELDIGTRARNALIRSVRCRGERGFALLTQRWKTLQHVTASPGRIGLIARAAFVLVLFEHKMIT